MLIFFVVLYVFLAFILSIFVVSLWIIFATSQKSFLEMENDKNLFAKNKNKKFFCPLLFTKMPSSRFV
jgi:hypothetical protein